MALCLAVDGLKQADETQLDEYLQLMASGPKIHPGRTKPDRHLLLFLSGRTKALQDVEAEVNDLMAQGMKSLESDTRIRESCVQSGKGLAALMAQQTESCLVKRLCIGPAQQHLLTQRNARLHSRD
jgi:hypothetical protein